MTQIRDREQFRPKRRNSAKGRDVPFCRTPFYPETDNRRAGVFFPWVTLISRAGQTELLPHRVVLLPQPAHQFLEPIVFVQRA